MLVPIGFPSQVEMNSTIELIQMEPFWNLDIRTKIGFSILIVLIQGFGIIVQRQLISFLKCNQKRYVNQIIFNNLILQNIFYPPQLLYYLIDIWGFSMGQHVGLWGVYGLIFAGLFIVNYDRAHSLFINFFRYICIAKEESLRENHILPKVSLILKINRGKYRQGATDTVSVSANISESADILVLLIWKMLIGISYWYRPIRKPILVVLPML